MGYLDDGAGGACLRVGVRVGCYVSAGAGGAGVRVGEAVGETVGAGERGVYVSIFTTTGRLPRLFMAVKAKLEQCPTVCGRLAVVRSIM